MNVTTRKNKRFYYFYDKNKQIIFAYIMMLLVLIVYIVNQPNFFSAYGIKSTFDQLQPLTYAALGQTVVLITKGTDLSIGALVGLANCVAATYMMPIGESLGSPWLGILIVSLLAVLAGTLAGAFNGMIIIKGNIQPMVVTLATSFVFTGIALYIRPTSGGEVYPEFAQLGKYIPGTKIPMSIIWLLVAAVCIWIPVRKSRFGQAIYAVGGNESAAYASGINVAKTKLKVYMFSGAVCGLGGVILTAYNRSGSATGCESATMNAVAVSVLGGTALTGGKGGFVGTIAGIVIYSLILGLLIFWGVNAYYQSLFKGAILIFAVAINMLDRIRFRKKGASAND